MFLLKPLNPLQKSEVLYSSVGPVLETARTQVNESLIEGGSYSISVEIHTHTFKHTLKSLYGIQDFPYIHGTTQIQYNNTFTKDTAFTAELCTECCKCHVDD